MQSEWEYLSSDELFELHQAMQSVLREKLIAKRKMLEDQLHRLNQGSDIRLKDSANLVALQWSIVVDDWAWHIMSLLFAEPSPAAFQVPQSS